MISLTIIEGDQEFFDGFPESVSFETDVPSTVYYTLDGSDPTEDSLIAIGKVFLPTLSGTLQLRAVAISGGDSSDTVTAQYENSSINLDGRRILGDEGIIVMRYGDDPVDSLGYTSDGEEAQETSIAVGDLALKVSRTNSGGDAFSGGKTSREFINFSLKNQKTTPNPISTPNNNPNFDPSAKFIIIDGSTEEARNNQVVKIVNLAILQIKRYRLH